MLDTTTKRRIDTARDILVGKVPDPKSQVEQITIALIYKFMDDMDAEAEEFGGERKFFAAGYARYGWAKLMRSGLGGHETLNLYSEAITKMPENPGIPPLFRDIFKNAYLPYRDPETLRAFLKVIDEFEYDHSERLGDAFEYLLSVLGSQGDAGQFRTPRHIIDFIVEVLDPKKNETVLDPACGTAGFLISAYKYILKTNSSPEAISSTPVEDNDKAALDSSRISPARGDLLSPDERGRLAANFKGFDISPDMVRLSLVNMYLHGFTDPHIYEYDTLTSEERWNEYADVILANPPFMSPKGGIKPHKRFSVQSKRSEVLFVDYMAEHLTPTGRAGIIVPEGIIFQSQTSYKQLRKMLVENYLVAVVSLPAGVFQPYSGVKTSILILDKSLARQSDTIAFFKVENDGFGLGAQRRPIDKNDLPAAKGAIKNYELRIIKDEGALDPDFITHNPSLIIVPKSKISANGDYSLSGERHREVVAKKSSFPLVPLGEVCDLYQPKTISQKDFIEDGPYPVFGANGVIGRYSEFNHEEPQVIVTCRGATCGTVNKSTPNSWITGNAMVIKPKDSHLFTDFLFSILKNADLSRSISGSAQPQITRQGLSPVQIPLPPLEIQKEIVAEIEGYQKVIDGSRAVIDNYRPHIPVQPEWPLVELGEVCELYQPKTITQQDLVTDGPYLVFGANGVIGRYTEYNHEEPQVIITCRGATCGTVNKSEPKSWITGNAMVAKPKDTQLSKEFLLSILKGSDLSPTISGSAQPQITRQGLAPFKIPLPPLETQRAIVTEIEAEQALVNANRELISRMEKTIQATLARVWGEKPDADAIPFEQSADSTDSELLVAEEGPSYNESGNSPIHSKNP